MTEQAVRQGVTHFRFWWRGHDHDPVNLGHGLWFWVREYAVGEPEKIAKELDGSDWRKHWIEYWPPQQPVEI